MPTATAVRAQPAVLEAQVEEETDERPPEDGGRSVPALTTRQQRFDRALRNVIGDDPAALREAAVALEALGMEQPADEISPEALYEAGQIFGEHLAAPTEAARCFRRLLSAHPRSRLVPRVTAKLREIMHGLETGAEALTTFQAVQRSTQPGSVTRREKLLALLAQKQVFALQDELLFLLADTELSLGMRADADRHFLTLHTQFPSSTWSARGHRRQIDDAARTRDLGIAAEHAAALAAFPDPWPAIGASEARLLHRLVLQQRVAYAVWALLIGVLTWTLVRTKPRRKLLWPIPTDVLFYVPLAGFFAAVAWATQGATLGLPIVYLALGGTGVAWWSAALQRTQSQAPQRTRHLLASLAVRTGVALGVVWLVVYHAALVDLVLDTLRHGPDADW